MTSFKNVAHIEKTKNQIDDKEYTDMSKEELEKELTVLKNRLKSFKEQNKVIDEDEDVQLDQLRYLAKPKGWTVENPRYSREADPEWQELKRKEYARKLDMYKQGIENERTGYKDIINMLQDHITVVKSLIGEKDE